MLVAEGIAVVARVAAAVAVVAGLVSMRMGP